MIGSACSGFGSPFFLVVATVLFGVIQCFEGGWQIYKAYYPSR
jgi:hypothetical protein